MHRFGSSRRDTTGCDSLRPDARTGRAVAPPRNPSRSPFADHDDRLVHPMNREPTSADNDLGDADRLERLRLGSQALDEMVVRLSGDPVEQASDELRDFGPPGLLGLALTHIVERNPRASAAREGLGDLRCRLRRRLHRRPPTPAGIAFAGLAGVATDLDTLEPGRSFAFGDLRDDVPIVALVESHRLDAGLPPVLDGTWFLRRFRRWSGQRFVSPLLGIWAIARWLRRFESRDPATTDGASDPAPHPHAVGLRTMLPRMVEAHRRADGGVGRFDPLLHESLAALVRIELGLADRGLLDAAARMLDAASRPAVPETPFHDAAIGPIVDPDRRIGTALASIALHEIDGVGDARFRPACPPDPYRIECRLGDDAAAQTRLNLRGLEPRHDRPLVDPGDPFETPQARVALGDAIDHAIARLGPALVSSRAATRLRRAASRIADAHVKGATIGLELRLHPGDDAVDLSWCLRRRDRNLTALLDAPDPSSSVRHLARLWNPPPNGAPPPIAFLDAIWLEHDLHHEDGSMPPAFFFGPSAIQLAATPHHGVREAAANLRRVVEALELDSGAADHLHRTAGRLERLPIARGIFQTGIMFSRPGHPVRICFLPSSDRAELGEMLRGLECAGPAAGTDRVLDAITEARGRVAVCIDLAPDGVLPRLGLETYRPDDVDTASFHASALDRLSRDHRCGVVIEPGRLEALLRVEGWTELCDAGGCHRSINHLKFAGGPKGPVEVKAYVAINRRATPAFLPPAPRR